MSQFFTYAVLTATVASALGLAAPSSWPRSARLWDSAAG